MKQIALAYYEHTYLVVIALLIFFIAFIAIVVSTFRKSNEEIYKELEKLPLEEEGNES
jgi:cbb3-type cytochrome oxidase subunit 3